MRPKKKKKNLILLDIQWCLCNFLFKLIFNWADGGKTLILPQNGMIIAKQKWNTKELIMLAQTLISFCFWIVMFDFQKDEEELASNCSLFLN